jgi:uncharacterized membrane protein YdjX (TVP38/TMEM64 family)
VRGKYKPFSFSSPIALWPKLQPMIMGADPIEKTRPAGSENPLLPVEDKPPWRRIVLVALVLLGLLVIVYVSPLRSYLGRLQELRDTIRGFGLLAPVVLTLGIAVLVGVGFSRLILCTFAGMAMGFWWGLLWAQLGALLGNYVLFLVARKGGGDWVRRYIAKRQRLASLIHDEGMIGVIIARQLPVPGMLVNFVLGLVSLKQRDFLLGTLIGQLPEAIPFTLIGAGVIKPSLAKSAGLIGLAVVFAVLVWVGLRWLVSKRRKP